MHAGATSVFIKCVYDVYKFFSLKKKEKKKVFLLNSKVAFLDSRKCAAL